jgi:hypothetical protein
MESLVTHLRIPYLNKVILSKLSGQCLLPLGGLWQALGVWLAVQHGSEKVLSCTRELQENDKPRNR